MPERMRMHPETHPPLQPIHHRIDAEALVRLSVVVDQQVPVRDIRPVPSLVSLDGSRQLRCDRHPA
jgi:hypothetical protein